MFPQDHKHLKRIKKLYVKQSRIKEYVNGTRTRKLKRKINKIEMLYKNFDINILETVLTQINNDIKELSDNIKTTNKKKYQSTIQNVK